MTGARRARHPHQLYKETESIEYESRTVRCIATYAITTTIDANFKVNWNSSDDPGR
jgi:hypothetical protein